ncbi:MAG: sugar transferase [Acidobacteriaceae bacterium]|nr:sugar transferase [Acidobacteriaceae bacterium]
MPNTRKKRTEVRGNDGIAVVDALFSPVVAQQRAIASEETFKRVLTLERKRSDRSRQPFLLMLIDAGTARRAAAGTNLLRRTAAALLVTTRETDVVGWYREAAQVGVLFTALQLETGGHNQLTVVNTILERVRAALKERLTADEAINLTFSFHFFPDDWDGDALRPSDGMLYPDLHRIGITKRTLLVSKRLMDIVGSTILLAVCAPLLAVIAAAVKLSSDGPILFRQTRVGQHGRHFQFLKFRSMRTDNDPSVHREYVTRLISGAADRVDTGSSETGVYKLANDTRVTAIGRLLRKTSLDELPQLLHVVQGHMSLVGPRPPIPYEVAAYQIWHRRRVLEMKPGITGLWQVMGRSRVKFDDMVRLDLRYAASWSPWLDFKILWRTPGAVIKGAY